MTPSANLTISSIAKAYKFVYERDLYCRRNFNAVRLRISGAPGPAAGAAGGGGEATATRGAGIATTAGAAPVARYAPPAARLRQVRVYSSTFHTAVGRW